MSNDRIDKTAGIIFPVLAMRGMVMFPGIVMHFDVAREKSIEALKAALAQDRKIFLVTQREVETEDPTEADLFSVGVVAEIKQVLRTPDNVTRVLVEGLYKAKLIHLKTDDAFMSAEVKKLPNYSRAKIDELQLAAMERSLKEIFEQYSVYVPRMPKELFLSIMGEKDPYKLFENIVFNTMLSPESKQEMLESSSILTRLTLLLTYLTKEVEILQIEQGLQEQVREQIEQNQRDYYLREQLKAISSQLGEDENFQEEAMDYIQRIEVLNLPEETASKLTKEANRLMKMSPSSQEAFVIRNYLDTCLELPWNTSSKERVDVKKARNILDHDHYGLAKVKDRILELIAVRQLSPNIKGQIICLVGPPGIGKTSIGKSIAQALNRKYARVSLGGIRDESDIRGHRKTYIGSMPGRIINAIKTAGTNNPLILLDEIDKMSHDFRGDPSSALLEVLDSEQNHSFRDHYIEVSFDLSNVLFVTTANTTQSIDPPLLDRMEVIELTSYTREEKFNIAKKHLIPKQIKANGLEPSMLRISNDGIYALTDNYTKEAGVRRLERAVASLCRKAAKEIVENQVSRVSISAKNIQKYLGPAKYLPDEFSEQNQVGVVNGLAWTSVGGVIMPLEVLILDGKGTVELTGSLGDVMKESARIAVSYTRSVADQYNIPKDFYKEKDMHIHAPEGAVPKDGPSAGVALTTALISALSGLPVRGDVAMTGEITLHGKVLPIGGLREKTMAAYKAGMKTVIIPHKNRGDLEEVDEAVKKGLEFVFAEDLNKVLETALIFDPSHSLKPTQRPETPSRNFVESENHQEEQIPPSTMEKESENLRM